MCQGAGFAVHFDPPQFPALIADGYLLKIALQNAVSNATKYGKEGGTITISVALRGHNLVISVCNEPGDDHERLLALKSTDIVFEKKVRLHTTSHEGISSGDGGWIMQQCAKAMAGNCVLKFSPSHTEWILQCPARVHISDQLSAQFKLPLDTIVLFVDDSSTQRKLFPLQLSKALDLSKERIRVIGSSRCEAVEMHMHAVQLMQQQPQCRMLLISDENLDYDHHDCISGSAKIEEIRKMLTELGMEERLLALVRSGNDSKSDRESFEARAHGVLPKSVSKPSDIMAAVTRLWYTRFGCSTSEDICPADSEELVQVVQLLVDESDAVLALLDGFAGKQWGVVWQKLHAMKGTCQTVRGMGVSGRMAYLCDEITQNVNELRSSDSASRANRISKLVQCLIELKASGTPQLLSPYSVK